MSAALGEVLSRRPEVLYEASLERRAEAQLLFANGAWALSMFVGGLAVESLLQAFALRRGAPHDARHSLDIWLRKCPTPLIDAVHMHAETEWAVLQALWSNDLRYLSFSGLLGRLRETRANRGIKLGKGGSAAVAREMPADASGRH